MTVTSSSQSETPTTEGPTSVHEYRAPQRYLSPAVADGVNDQAIFGPKAREILVLDTQGRKVFQATRAGASSIVWNGRDSSGRLVESGVYVVRIRRDNGETAYQSLAVVK